MNLLDVSDLVVTRGGMRILEGISFSLDAGCTLVLSGRNGIGKTSLLRTIIGLQPCEGGEVRADADDLAYSAHADGLKGALTVAENLQFWAAIYGQKHIADGLEAMNLTDLRHRPAARLSAGQRRRLGLARLLISKRKVWLMDEPTVSLDAGSVDLVRSALVGHMASGGAALVATHLELGIDADRLDLEAYRAKPRMSSDGFDASGGFL